jgi:hypothetical protein
MTIMDNTLSLDDFEPICIGHECVDTNFPLKSKCMIKTKVTKFTIIVIKVLVMEKTTLW